MARAIDADAVKFSISGLSYISPYDYFALAEYFMKQVKAMPTLTQPNEALPVLVNDEPDREYIDYICPRCKNTISQRRRGQRMETVYQCKYHDNCGQRVDWENPQPYRRPPEEDGGDVK